MSHKHIMIRRTITFAGSLSRKMPLPDCSLERRFRARKIISDGSMERLGTIRISIQVTCIFLKCYMFKSLGKNCVVVTIYHFIFQSQTLLFLQAFRCPASEIVWRWTPHRLLDSGWTLIAIRSCPSRAYAIVRFTELFFWFVANFRQKTINFRNDKSSRQLYLLRWTLGGGHTGILDMTPKNYTFLDHFSRIPLQRIYALWILLDGRRRKACGVGGN